MERVWCNWAFGQRRKFASLHDSNEIAHAYQSCKNTERARIRKIGQFHGPGRTGLGDQVGVSKSGSKINRIFVLRDGVHIQTNDKNYSLFLFVSLKSISPFHVIIQRMQSHLAGFKLDNSGLREAQLDGQ